MVSNFSKMVANMKVIIKMVNLKVKALSYINQEMFMKATLKMDWLMVMAC